MSDNVQDRLDDALRKIRAKEALELFGPGGAIAIDDPDCGELIKSGTKEVLTSQNSRWGLSIKVPNQRVYYHFPPHTGLIFS